MRLSDAEKDFVKKTCNMYNDERIADELTRIRYDLNIKDRVSVRQVRRARYNMNIKNRQGMGKCQIDFRKDEDDE